MAEKIKLLKETKKYFSGGVNSPVRSFKSVDMTPIIIKSGSGSKIKTYNNKTYIDYCMSWGAIIYGHSNTDIIGAVKNQLSYGTSYGFTNIYEVELAKEISKALPSVEKIRFVNSGTEATMGAVRVARKFTSRNKILKFEGCYHGSSDLLLRTDNSFIVSYNDLESVEKTVKKHYRSIAAVIVEPIAGNMGVILPDKNFLMGLRNICNRYEIILIFDEVITGFRIQYGGAQIKYNIKPDLTCLGKIIGGGFPVGAFGGKKEIMELLAPSGDLYQAGTFSGNPISMIAGLKTLQKLEYADYGLIEGRTEYLCDFIENEAKKNSVDIQINRIGSMFSLFFINKKVYDYVSVKKQNVKKFKKFYKLLFNKSVLFSPSPFESNFISFAHTQEDIEKTIKIFSSVLRRIR